MTEDAQLLFVVWTLALGAVSAVSLPICSAQAQDDRRLDEKALQVTHRNVCHVFDIGQVGGRH